MHLFSARWDNPQTFYWHVKSHAGDLEDQEPDQDIVCAWAGCHRRDNAISKLKVKLKWGNDDLYLTLYNNLAGTHSMS